MKTFIFLSLLAALISTCSADSHATKTKRLKLAPDAHGLVVKAGSNIPYTGKDISYFDNGQEFEEKTYVNGVLRKYFSWDKIGKKRLVKTFETDGVLKDYILWYANGQKAYEEYYVDHMKRGVSASWNQQGQKISEAHYSDGKVNGLMTTWHENGQKSSEEKRLNGFHDGPVLRWERDGTRIP